MPPHASVRTLSNDHLLALVTRTGAGDLVAFGELYGLTNVWVRQIVFRTTRSPEYAAEVVQDVFLQVWQQSATFVGERGPVLGWLAMLAHRRAVDRVRQVDRARARDQREIDLRASSVDIDDVAEIGLARLEAARVRGALDLLSPEHREAIVLTFVDGHTHAQAAQLLAIPMGTLKSRIRAALVRLRRHLDPAPA